MKKKYLIIIANYYEDIAKGLLDSALKLIPKSNFIKIIKVPGVFEIPVTISKNIKKYDAFLALGCVIKGETPHFDFISQASTNAIMDLSINNQKPIGNGIITCLNMRQAKARKASYFFIFFEIVTGISKTPGTLMILIILDFGINFKALSRRPFAISS